MTPWSASATSLLSPKHQALSATKNQEPSTKHSSLP